MPAGRGDQPRARVEIRSFAGFATDIDPSDAPPGLADKQVNCESQDEGVLTSRRAYSIATFESVTTAT
jgi:hypothetical protein